MGGVCSKSSDTTEPKNSKKDPFSFIRKSKY